MPETDVSKHEASGLGGVVVAYLVHYALNKHHKVLLSSISIEQMPIHRR